MIVSARNETDNLRGGAGGGTPLDDTVCRIVRDGAKIIKVKYINRFQRFKVCLQFRLARCDPAPRSAR